MPKFIPFIVTTKMLTDMDACADQVELFKKTFGSSVKVTPEVLRKANKVNLDLRWFTFRVVAKDGNSKRYGLLMDAIDKMDALLAGRKRAALMPLYYTKAGNFRKRVDSLAVEKVHCAWAAAYTRRELTIIIRILGMGPQKMVKE